MMQDSTYHGFDKSVWCFNNGKDYPKLKIFNNCYTDIITKPINSESEDIKIYPNPVSSILHVNYQLSEKSSYRILISDLLGNNIILNNNYIQQECGFHNIDIDIKDISSGTYFLLIDFGNSLNVKQFTVLK